MAVDRIGYGAGQKDFPQANILRLLVGEVVSATGYATTLTQAHLPKTESIVLLETNLDNVTGETVAHAVDCLWSAGALDVSLAAIQMKKGRPGVLLSVQTRPADADQLEKILFRETQTLGVRRTIVLRIVLAREALTVETTYGPVTAKVAVLPDGSRRFTPEYESCHRIATASGIPLANVMSAASDAWRAAAGQDGRAI
jgi:uncharacterized protein (DUF111 family)